MPEKNYTYYDFTLSICSTCLRRVDAKVIFEDEKVFMIKHCPHHGKEKVLIATDIDYYKNTRNYNKPSEAPLKTNTSTHYGCPYDCGLCKDHEQHSCLSVIEVTDRCNLTCPTCYAMSSPHYGRHRTLEEIEQMLDIIVENEGQPDVVQLSGGEPTIHPQFFEILDIAKTKPIRHLMINTNGVRIAKDKEFTARLATYMPDFEVYLQFDSFKPEALERMRGKDLTDVRKQALENLNEVNLSTTLVVTLQRGVNEDEMGAIIDYALKQPCVRGVTFQPVQVAGRTDGFDPATDRITLTEVRQRILEQSPIWNDHDIIPVPCNPDALAMAYALKIDGQVYPLTRYVDPAVLLNNSKNTIVYEQDERLHQHILKIFSTGISTDAAVNDMQSLLCCLPQVQAPGLDYTNLFRIVIMRFLDAYDFDVRAIKKSCVHIVHKDGRIIPFETMNLFYRDDKEAYLKQLQEERTFIPIV
ncbi:MULTISPECIES: radical SAM protein [Chitinophaga]|uniref:radical SAM protein n=1 Tax=Chitinophaga TaxID=79328 RepID=UPI000DBA5475|nr:radical SAM protein [Chitinophaga ginsengisegetis]MDR6570242.1 putative radical SAM superfamily Fe-S cluster-containing enzyme [Chitinophaga ginsengisegetis]MDR6649976.1 putative radical SAM superfamily Fe-S cluster-containing enzyme [Chitinophaga ginsengisegetis]MDR6656383.1 putative radical SAM superfamily Fe-S cluster-containing enzyme [Chitinophaga ginsengisegetis]